MIYSRRCVIVICILQNTQYSVKWFWFWQDRPRWILANLFFFELNVNSLQNTYHNMKMSVLVCVSIKSKIKGLCYSLLQHENFYVGLCHS